MVKVGKRDKDYQRKVARERVMVLFDLAERTANTHPERSRRYVELAWKVAKKHRVKLGKLKYRFCRKCYTWWTDETLRVRIVQRPYPMVVYKCLTCGEEYRIPIVREKKERRKAV